MALKTILQRTYLSLFSVDFKKKTDTNNIVVLLEYKDGIKLVCANGYKRHCYPVLAGLIVYYEEQILIIGIKVNMQCSICHVPSKEKDLVNRS